MPVAMLQWSVCWWSPSKRYKWTACWTRRPEDCKTAEASATDCSLQRAVLGFGAIAVAAVVAGDGVVRRPKRDDGDGKTWDLYRNEKTITSIIMQS